MVSIVFFMGRKPEDAENLMDKMIEQRDLVKDMDSAVAEGLDEDMGDLDDMLADLDKEMAADKMHDLPEAGKDEPTAKVPANCVFHSSPCRALLRKHIRRMRSPRRVMRLLT